MLVKQDRSRHSSFMAMLDFLFNLVLAFATLVILLLMVIKAESSSSGIENKNEFILTVQWDDGSNDDVDTWVMDPSGKIVSFQSRDVPGMLLQRDDLGRINKTIYDTSTGKVASEILPNMEVVNFTSWKSGQYNVNLHLYKADISRDGDILVKVKLIKVNPFSEPASLEIRLPRSEVGKEVTALNFIVNDKGEITGTSQLPVMFVYSPMDR